MPFSGIYAITDDQLLGPERIIGAVQTALEAGISLLQYRSKSGSDSERYHIAQALQHLCHRFQVPLIINDDIELCHRVGAAGVHLGRQDASLESARSRLGSGAIIGVTCHDSLESALGAEQAGASYVAFGRFFPSHTKPQATAASISTLIQARQRLSIPIVAIGGINAENGAAILAAGADMLAVVHALFGSEDIAGNARKLVDLCRTQADSRQHTGPETHDH